MPDGLVFNIQKFCIQDGPGIRTTVFLKGCPLQCWWCHNPESQRREAEIVLLDQRCIGCEQCVAACPFSAPVTSAEREQGDTQCILCGACVDACPAEARQLVGRSMPVTEVLAEVLRDRMFYEQSGGGVTLSGGEPLQQPEFAQALLAACRREEVHTALDTSGAVAWERLAATLPVCDLFLYDLKVIDEERHRAMTGASNRQILANLHALGEAGAAIWVRVPIIPGCNDDTQNLRATAELAAAVRSVQRVELLPYHRAGMQKFERVGQAYRLADVQPPTAARMEELAGYFRCRGLETIIGGSHERTYREAEGS